MSKHIGFITLLTLSITCLQFGAYFLLASVLTVLTSNDVVILTLTPIVIHFAKVTKTDPAPLLFLEFYAANTWSMALLIGCAATTAPIALRMWQHFVWPALQNHVWTLL